MTNFKFTYKFEGDTVIFYTNKGILSGRINSWPNEYFLCLDEYYNDILFSELKVDKIKFSEKVLGYKVGDGAWPEMKSRKDVIKVIDRLMIYSKAYGEY